MRSFYCLSLNCHKLVIVEMMYYVQIIFKSLKVSSKSVGDLLWNAFFGNICSKKHFKVQNYVMHCFWLP